MKTININNFGRRIGLKDPVYIIAEGGLTNWGDLSLAKQQVDVAMAAGADAIKFQAQTTEELVSRKVSDYWYRRLKYKELSHSDLLELRDYCNIRNIDFFVTAHTEKDLEFVDKVLDVPFFKVGSGESVNLDFIRNIGKRGKPVMLSTGLHSSEESIIDSVTTLESVGCKDIIILHCNTLYPTPFDVVNLGAIGNLQQKLDYPVGYSDHTVGWHIPLAAVTLGARVIEKHISFQKDDKRSLDCMVSCEPSELQEMVMQIRDVESALMCDHEKRAKLLLKAKNWARQSIVASRNLEKGHVLALDDISFKRPGTGMEPGDVHQIIGKRLITDVGEDELILQGLISKK